MTGLIWTIQILHYPAFLQIDERNFLVFHTRHSNNITFIVAPVMLIELLTAGLLIWNFQSEKIFWINGVMLILIWLATALLSVPLHQKLTFGKDHHHIQRLVITNWPRTFLWSARLALITFFLVRNSHVNIVTLSQ